MNPTKTLPAASAPELPVVGGTVVPNLGQVESGSGPTAA
jgi:hypothetical protein